MNGASASSAWAAGGPDGALAAEFDWGFETAELSVDASAAQVEEALSALLDVDVQATKTGHYDKIGQAFVVLLPTVKSVGVMGDHRTYENVCVLRAVTTSDFMTADWYAREGKGFGIDGVGRIRGFSSTV